MGCFAIGRTFASLELMCFEILTTTILEIALLRAAGLLENFPSCFLKLRQDLKTDPGEEKSN